MAVLIGKLDNLVLDRRAISRPDTFYFSRVEWRLMQILTNLSMHTFGRIAYKTLNLRLFYPFRRKRERNWCLVAPLRFGSVPGHRPAIESRRSPRVESSHRKPMILKGFRPFD